MNNNFSQYDVDYISGVMSLRSPQKKSLEILDNIMQNITVKKGMNKDMAIASIKAMYPTFSDFERNFMSLTFALATGVGKTRLMGAFITYLYTNYNIKNFFIVAPGTTIYNKLQRDLGDPSNSKYVFKGVGCFPIQPQIIVDEDYRTKTLSIFESDIRIFIYNIDKFNKDVANIKKINEILGDSFYQYLSKLDDLTVIMDESHHYRAEKGMAAINELNPMLGLELTATPLVTQKNKQIPFKNVVYEYPLSKAIEDGYTRTPFAITRSDIDFYNFGDEQLDKIMLLDGIKCHERTKTILEAYANNNNKKLVKPFMMVVCKDTEHAKWVQNYICSDEFRDGYYKYKTIVIHSKQKGSESEENTKLLLDVENPLNTIEIVIHVNMLKEGWDVNNLYTIVPLRTAASKILREQMVGRGLRLPYGERVGDPDIDAVMLTAHDKFNDILAEAQKGDSIFKAGNVILADEIVPTEVTYADMNIFDFITPELDKVYENIPVTRTNETDKIIKQASEQIKREVTSTIQRDPSHSVSKEKKKEIIKKVSDAINNDEDLAETFKNNANPIINWFENHIEKTAIAAIEKFIPIPRIKVTDYGVEEYNFTDFDIDFSDFNHVPIKNEILRANLEDPSDIERIQGDNIDFEGYRPEKAIIDELRKKPEIDYEKCGDLVQKLILQICKHYEDLYLQNGMRNIIMMYKKDISNKIYNQMMQHFYCTNGFLKEEVIGTRDYNIQPAYTFNEKVRLFDEYKGNITSILFTNIKKGVFSEAKFDSRPELILARALERDNSVLNWLRPAPNEFNITYNRGHNYEPDFVVECDENIFLIEVKGEDKINDPDVLAKKDRAIKYCDVASRWGKANGYKEWKHLFIPSKQIMENSTLHQLASRFTV